jgi:ankyrin repeat protein
MPNTDPDLSERLEVAVRSSDVNDLRAVLRDCGSAAVRRDVDPDELTLLHLAASLGNEAVVSFLLSSEVAADPGAARNNAFTPLHAAAMHGHTGVCELLLQAGANVNAQTDPQFYAPLHSAAFAGHLQTISLLIAHGADRTAISYRGETPQATARRQHQDGAAALLASDAGAIAQAGPYSTRH